MAGSRTGPRLISPSLVSTLFYIVPEIANDSSPKGTSVAVYGTYGKEGNPDHPPKATYTIDDTPLARGTGAVTSTPQYNQLFFQSPPLEDREHVLVITVSVDHGARYWLDYFLFMPSNPIPATGTTTATAISTSGLSPVHDTTGTAVIDSSTPAVTPLLPNTASTSRTTQARSPPLLPSRSPNASGVPPSFVPPPPQSSPIAVAAAKAKPSNTAAIVGGVFSSLVLVTAAALLAIFFYRRRRNSRASATSAYLPVYDL
jgi:hypothetical protein